MSLEQNDFLLNSTSKLIFSYFCTVLGKKIILVSMQYSVANNIGSIYNKKDENIAAHSPFN